MENIQKARPEKECMHNFKIHSYHLLHFNCSYKWSHIAWKMFPILLQSCSQKTVLSGLQFRLYCLSTIRVVLVSWLAAVLISFFNPLREACLIKLDNRISFCEGQQLDNPIRLTMWQTSEEKSYPIHPYRSLWYWTNLRRDISDMIWPWTTMKLIRRYKISFLEFLKKFF